MDDMEKTLMEWEHRYRDFAEILRKLDESELQSLTFIFDCYPHQYDHSNSAACSDRKKQDYVESLWSKFRDLKRGAADSFKLRQALSVLR